MLNVTTAEKVQIIADWKKLQIATGQATEEQVERIYGNLVPLQATHRDSQKALWIRVNSQGEPARNGFWISTESLDCDAYVGSGKPNW